MSEGFATRCIYGNLDEFHRDTTGSIVYPIYQTSTFQHEELGHENGFQYTRLQNPTREHLEKVVAALEGGLDCLAFSSGMAAIALMMELFRPGDHIITDLDLYGGSIRLFDHVSTKNGLVIDRVDCREPELVAAAVTPQTKAIFIETPTNPMMNVIDIAKMAEIAKAAGALLIVDNTFLTPYFQKPFELGADIIIHSGTKFLGGHNDTLAGFVVTNSQKISDDLRFLTKTIGSGLAPFDCFLVARGIKTLAIRMEQAQKNAQAVVAFLQQRPEVTAVYYPGIPGTASYEICAKQATGFGSMISFEVTSPELALHVLRHTRMIPFAESLGGTETLLTYPITQTHAEVPAKVREKNGLTDRLLRISVGIEDVEDIVADLEQAFASFAG